MIHSKCMLPLDGHIYKHIIRLQCDNHSHQRLLSMQTLISIPNPHSKGLKGLVPPSPRRLLILPQPHQHLPKALLPRPTRSTLRTLPAKIHQLRNTLPACPARTRILPLIQILLGFFAGFGDRLVLFGVVVVVEVVDVLLGLCDGVGLFGGGD